MIPLKTCSRLDAYANESALQMGPLLNNEKIYFQSESPLNWWSVVAVAHGEDVIFHMEATII